ncbi:MAG: ATP-binding protein [Chloroflexia bacterium]
MDRYARALILFGKRRSLGRLNLAHLEVVFEYRSTEASLPSQRRTEYREGFFLFYDELWNTIDLRNDVHQYLDGFVMREIKTFNESVAREAILNAASHRDYRDGRNIWVRQFPRKLEIESPGGFPGPVTAENILWTQYPRNRRIAEAFNRCGLVERAGQGANRMFEQSIRESKPRPDYSRSDHHHVLLTLQGEVRDDNFVKFLEKIGQETLSSFHTEDFLVLDLVHSDQTLPEFLRARVPRLLDLGVIERYGRGRGVRYILSKHFYEFVGQRATYTRKRGLDRETNKELLLRHITENNREGSRLEELKQVLPSQSRRTVQRLLSELKAEGRVHISGRTSAARWVSGPGEPSGIRPDEVEARS